MDEEFLMQVDEELPSDYRTAVKVIETKVLSEEYRSKLEMLLEKLEGLSAINNAEILREMNSVLAGLLESITAINSKYGFLSEMMLKLDETRPEILEKLDRLSSGMADILAGVQASLSSIEEKISVTSADPLLTDTVLKLEEKLNEISVVNAELGEKFENISGDSRETLGRMEEKLGDLGVSNASINEALERISQNNSDLTEKVGELSVSSAAASESMAGIEDRLDNISIGRSEMTSSLNELRVSVSELDERLGRLSGKMEEMSSIEPIEMDEVNEKLSGLSQSLMALEDKLNNTSIANSELLGGIHDSVRNIENKNDVVSDVLLKFDEKLADLASTNASASARLDEKIKSLETGISDSFDGINERLGELESRLAEKQTVEIDTSGLTETLDMLNQKIGGLYSVVENLNDKLNESLIQNKELSDKVDQLPAGDAGGLRDELASVGRKIESKIESRDNEMLDRIDKRIELASEEAHRLRREMEALDSRLKKEMEEIIGAIKGLQKPKVAKRKRKRKASPKRRRPVRRRTRRAQRPRRVRRVTVDNETLDTLIVTTLNTASMNLVQLRNTTKIGEKKLRERLDILMARGVVVRERRGRSIFYVSQAEQPMPSG